ncbi:response regulator transcription factor [Streptomyces ferrugineus]|uniref:Response regulator transcription factor n=1 Tax=Streptomyces ferrugineus TaxID=1413221 RepID=A0A7M2SYQ1_9ACTN|nr:response regulator transcription factor [Streptomyces ferrugineus]
MSNPAIAARLHLVEGTVKAYVSAALDRLGARNRVQAAIVAYEAGLAEALRTRPREPPHGRCRRGPQRLRHPDRRTGPSRTAPPGTDVPP